MNFEVNPIKILGTLLGWPLLFACLSSCAPAKPTALQNARLLSDWLCGDYHTKPPTAEKRKDYLDIRVHIRRVWPKDKSSQWLYVEQAIAENGQEKLVYRQRVYQIMPYFNDSLVCHIHTFQDSSGQWVGAYKTPEAFDRITHANLNLQKGCSIYFMRRYKSFYGDMRNKTCVNTLRGSQYVESEQIIVDEKKIQTADQGIAYKKNRRETTWGGKQYTFEKQ